MEIRELSTDSDLAAAAALAVAAHARLRERLPFLPGRGPADLAPRIGWMAREGELLGIFREGALSAFLGGFVVADFRNAGRGAFCPDWCMGRAVEGTERAAEPESERGPLSAFARYRALYRELAQRFRAEGAPIHGLGIYATESDALEAFSLTGFGRIMMDAARPTNELRAELSRAAPARAELARRGRPDRGETAIRRAQEEDAAALAALDAALASHIASSPVLMPNPHGRTEAQWEEWLQGEGAVAFVAQRADSIVGFMKAETPQFDVSYAVHGEGTLAIDGLYVEPGSRGSGLGAALLAAIADRASELGKSLVSVDCETMNPEAFAFWTARFLPLAWGFERRT